MKILVTGGAGFIGSNFVEMFTQDAFPQISEIVVLDELTYAGSLENLDKSMTDSRVSFIEGDICDFEAVQKATKGVDAILNFAAESHVDRSIDSAFEFVRTNILGVQNLLDVAKRNGLKRFLQVSTDEVYGSIATGSWSENETLLPNSPYAASKAAADLLVRSYSRTHGMDTIITRCSNNYGPRQYPEKIIPFFVKTLMSGGKVPIYGDGSNIRDWLHVTDHCQGIVIALTKGKAGEIYNIGGGTELRNIDLSKKILEILGFDDSRLEYVTDRKGHDQRYSVDWSKIAAIGYRPQKNWEIGITETVLYYKERFQQ